MLVLFAPTIEYRLVAECELLYDDIYLLHVLARHPKKQIRKAIIMSHYETLAVDMNGGGLRLDGASRKYQDGRSKDPDSRTCRGVIRPPHVTEFPESNS